MVVPKHFVIGRVILRIALLFYKTVMMRFLEIICGRFCKNKTVSLLTTHVVRRFWVRVVNKRIVNISIKITNPISQSLLFQPFSISHSHLYIKDQELYIIYSLLPSARFHIVKVLHFYL